ncbi:MAG TPA: hypothetical protein VF178_06740 [Gemmatimonadaceae bacterium]
MTTVSVALECIPEPHRETAATALRGASGRALPAQAQAVAGGASGALIYRVLVDEGWYLLRIETRDDAMRNPHQYTCLALAADAGVAPPVHLVDAAKGVVIMDFLTNHPPTTFPGGAPALVPALGELAARLQVMRVLTRLYYAGLVLAPFAWNPPAAADADLTPPTPEKLKASVANGELTIGTPEFMYVFGKMLLGGFLAGTEERRFARAMRVLVVP